MADKIKPSTPVRATTHPGVFVQGVGEYTEAGQAKTVAIAIGPEFGTVGPELIRDTAKEAARFRGLVRARWP